MAYFEQVEFVCLGAAARWIRGDAESLMLEEEIEVLQMNARRERHLH